MVHSFIITVRAYQDEIKNIPIVPAGYFGRSVVGADDLPTKMFVRFLFSHHEKGVKFLQECAVPKSEICPKYSSNMRLWESDSVIDKHRWRCGKGKKGERCNVRRGLGHSS
jgi:hypothetical protein